MLGVLLGVALVTAAVAVGALLLRTHRADHANTQAPPASVAPPAAGAQPIQLSAQLTDQSGMLGPLESDAVNRALGKL